MQATQSWHTVLGVMATALFLLSCIAVMATVKPSGTVADDRANQAWLLHDEAREVRLV